jgi:hypothetical protein
MEQARKLNQHELKPPCLPAVDVGARKNVGIFGLEELAVVVRGVVMPVRTFRLAAGPALKSMPGLSSIQSMSSALHFASGTRSVGEGE